MPFSKKDHRNEKLQQVDGSKGSSPAFPFFRTGASGKNIGDLIFENITRFFAFILLSLVLIMLFEMLRKSIPSIDKFGWGFITSQEWDPVHDNFGALPFIFGTLYSSLIALIIALPLSVGIAIFLSEFAPKWLEQPMSLLVELLAAIPSIVYGLF